VVQIAIQETIIASTSQGRVNSSSDSALAEKDASISFGGRVIPVSDIRNQRLGGADCGRDSTSQIVDFVNQEIGKKARFSPAQDKVQDPPTRDG
jgi:hypothetical protein